jgi:HEAT repeat protein
MLHLDKRAYPVLLEAMRDPDTAVRSSATRALSRLSALEPEVNAVLAGLLSSRSSTREAVEWVEQFYLRGPEAMKAIIAGLRDEDSHIRSCAIRALATVGPRAKDAVELLAAALTHTDQEVRYLAARALEDIGKGAQAAVPALLKARRDDERMVRSAALRALTKIDPQAVTGVESEMAATDGPHDP